MRPSGASGTIQCENLSVGHGRIAVLAGVDLHIAPGTLLPFVGPNGSGKTTLLRTLLGLLPVLAGRLSTPFGLRPPGYVAQAKSIDPLFPVTTLDVVSMGLFPALGWWRRPDRTQRRDMEVLLERFGLVGHRHRLFAELSGGMRQKALLARALLCGAEVLVMDEPATELDEGSERELLGHLREIASVQGRTVLVAHHGLASVASLSAEVVLVRQGRACRMGVRAARAALLGGEGTPCLS